MDDALTRAIERLAEHGFDLDTLMPDDSATLSRGREVVELRVQDGRVLGRGDIPATLIRHSAGSGDDHLIGRTTALAPLLADVEDAEPADTVGSVSTASNQASAVAPRSRRRRRLWLVPFTLLLLLALAVPVALLAFDDRIPLSIAALRGEGAINAQLAPAFGGREFDEATDLVPFGDGHVIVAERRGVIWLVDRVTGEATEFLDLTARVLFEPEERLEDGLLSIALGQGADELYVYHSAEDPLSTVLTRYSVSGDVADADSELVILEVPKTGTMHRGGAIRFGPDGMLYLGIGDSGNAMRAQELDSLQGTVIRIDVRGATEAAPYVIPPDNPFASDGDVRAEIWAYGFRNPWRMDFDYENGALWLADVGETQYEEVNLVRPGLNYGWPFVDGRSCEPAYPDCDLDAFTLPVATYEHRAITWTGSNCAIIGGAVYRGKVLPEVAGHFIFADLCSGRIWALDPNRGTEQEGPGDLIELTAASELVYSVNRGPGGEIYITTYSGPVQQLVPVR